MRLFQILGALARCERPTAAFCKASRLHPGRLAQGPEEKQGLFGFFTGFGYAPLTSGKVFLSLKVGAVLARSGAIGQLRSFDFSMSVRIERPKGKEYRGTKKRSAAKIWVSI